MGIERSAATFILALSCSLSACDLADNIPVGMGYTAKQLCSFVFTSGLDEDQVRDQFIAPKVQPLPKVWDVTVDRDQRQVHAGYSLLRNGPGSATAIYRPGKGCTLLVDRSTSQVDSIPFNPLPPPQIEQQEPWPLGAGDSERNLPGIDYSALDRAVAGAFTEIDSVPLQTTSVVVAYQGHLLAERYALGVTAATPMPGWSMTKSVTATLAGILVGDGKLQLDEPAPVPGWAGTDKGSITLRHLLTMSSGLLVDEDYGGLSDVTRMLYTHSNQFEYAATRPVITPPGTEFHYSTVETSRLAAAVQAAVGGSQQAMYEFYQRRLFHPLGIRSALIEFDATGHLVGGAYGYMSSRDWARLGQLYLQQGRWQEQQILPPDWVPFVSNPNPLTHTYGGHFWLNRQANRWAGVPEDAYAMMGHQGQRVVIIPSRDLVVVRTGVTEDRDLQNQLMTQLLQALLAALPNPATTPDS